MKLSEARQRQFCLLVLLAYIVWANASVFPVRAQERTRDVQAAGLIETGRALYRQNLFDEALNKLNDALKLGQSPEIRALVNVEMAYVRFLQHGAGLPVFRFLIHEALKLHPAIAIEQGLYQQGFVEAFLAVRTEGPRTLSQVVEKQGLQEAGRTAAPAKKRSFPWLGALLSLVLAGGLVYYFFIMKTTLQLDTVPSGARVYLDGVDTTQVTPCELRPALGVHTIKVVLEGYADMDREFVVKNGKNSLTIPLDLGTYSVLTPVANANVQREANCLITWNTTVPAPPMATMASLPAASTFSGIEPSGRSQPRAVRQQTGQSLGVTRVDLELFQAGKKVADIAKSVANSGFYTWNVPAATAEGHDFTIHIVSPAASASHAFGPAFNLLGFTEEFADGVADFWIPDKAASWSVGGGYFSGTKTSEKVGSAIYDFFYSETSYTVQSRMRWSEFSGSNPDALLFIMLATSKSFGGTSGYLLGYSIDGTVSIYSLINYKLGEPQADAPYEPPADPPLPIFRAANAAVNQGVGSWNTLKIVHSGSSYTLYINDIMVYTFVDSTYNPNYLVLGFRGDGTKTACDFDFVHMTVEPTPVSEQRKAISSRGRN